MFPTEKAPPRPHERSRLSLEVENRHCKIIRRARADRVPEGWAHPSERSIGIQESAIMGTSRNATPPSHLHANQCHVGRPQEIRFCAPAAEPFGPDLGRLLQRARFFRHPRDVVEDAALTTAERRAILSSWASDACAIESTPALRQIPGSGHVVRFDEVIDALQELDGKADDIGRIGEPQRKRRGSQRSGNSEGGPSGSSNW